VNINNSHSLILSNSNVTDFMSAADSGSRAYKSGANGAPFELLLCSLESSKKKRRSANAN